MCSYTISSTQSIVFVYGWSVISNSIRLSLLQRLEKEERALQQHGTVQARTRMRSVHQYAAEPIAVPRTYEMDNAYDRARLEGELGHDLVQGCGVQRAARRAVVLVGRALEARRGRCAAIHLHRVVS